MINLTTSKKLGGFRVVKNTVDKPFEKQTFYQTLKNMSGTVLVKFEIEFSDEDSIKDFCVKLDQYKSIERMDQGA